MCASALHFPLAMVRFPFFYALRLEFLHALHAILVFAEAMIQRTLRKKEKKSLFVSCFAISLKSSLVYVFFFIKQRKLRLKNYF